MDGQMPICWMCEERGYFVDAIGLFTTISGITAPMCKHHFAEMTEGSLQEEDYLYREELTADGCNLRLLDGEQVWFESEDDNSDVTSLVLELL